MKLKKEDGLAQRSRRSELGKMLLDVSKYLFTIGLIGGILTPQGKELTLGMGLAIFIVALVSAAMGFYVIPKDKEG